MADTAKRALMLVNGDLAPSLPHVQFEEYDLVLALDGALNLLHSLDQPPHVVVGDLDSVNEPALAWARTRGVAIVRETEQETTDFEKGMSFLEAGEILVVDVVGHRGGRLDHELANLSACAAWARVFAIRLIDPIATGVVLASGAEFTIPHHAGHLCSLMPLIPCRGVTAKGFRWPLQDAELQGASSLTCSNEIIANPAQVRLEQGALLVYLHRAR